MENLSTKMIHEIVFVTSNKGKIQSAMQFLDDSIHLETYNFDIEEPEINDIDYIAEYKVKQAYKKVGKPCISLDAGFYIKNYPNNPNFPGAFPKRELLEKIGIEGLLEKMKGVTNRNCYFKECLAYYDGNNVKKFYGTSYGSLSTEIKGNYNKKQWSELWFVFIPKNHEKTLAEMTDEERKNRNDGHTSPFVPFYKWLINNR